MTERLAHVGLPAMGWSDFKRLLATYAQYGEMDIVFDSDSEIYMLEPKSYSTGRNLSPAIVDRVR